MIAWWTGRGFLSLLTLIGVFGAFGAVVTFTVGDQAFEAYPWLWGLGCLPAAVVNWIVGCRLNRVPLNPLFALKDRLTYRPRNRFMSFPMELWSLPMTLLGVFLIVAGLIGQP